MSLSNPEDVHGLKVNYKI